MPRFNTTIEDYSPLISFDTNWSAGTSLDSKANLYSDSSFILTQADGASASFGFNGTRVSVFGSKRGNHGFYQVTVDGNVVSVVTGQVPDPGQFQVPLFSSALLNEGFHTVKLTNQGSTFLDIDFITYESSIGGENEKLVVNTVQDTDPSFVYAPANSWGTNVPSIGTYSGSSGHATATPGAFMTYTFKGVSLYGPVGPVGSPFSVSLDGGLPITYSANKQFYQPQVLLYTATNLGPGDHSIKMEYQPSQPGQIFAIDYANVFTTSAQNSRQSSSSKSALPGAAVAGIIISLVFLLFLLAGLLFFLRRRKAKQSASSLESQTVQRSANNTQILSGPTAYYPSAPSDNASSYRAPLAGTNRQGGGQTAYYPSDNESFYPAPIAVDYYVPPPVSESEFSPTSRHGGLGRAPSNATSQSTATSSNRSNQGMKGQPLPLPPTASQSLSHIPTSELRANRRVVPGRSQDFGPAPPNYLQATEPYVR
ncbi:hypothetical protein C8J57DRAFT_590483 [Mycena rebaudengoi]|nr:hypothetical protein C8J57DRAFT_590483 [Mycena rebaudengoi]